MSDKNLILAGGTPYFNGRNKNKHKLFVQCRYVKKEEILISNLREKEVYSLMSLLVVSVESFIHCKMCQKQILDILSVGYYLMLFTFSTSPKTTLDPYDLRHVIIRDLVLSCLESPAQTVYGIFRHLIRIKGDAGQRTALFRNVCKRKCPKKVA